MQRRPGEGRATATARVFFALWPDDAVRAALAEWAAALHLACGGRPTRTGNLHMTLAFLGDTELARVDALKHAAGRVAPRPFELVVDQPGYWKHNRIAWAGSSADPPALAEMVGALRGALTEAGFRFDAKPFVSHVTLLRKASAPEKLPSLPPIVWRASGFALVRSVPGPRGTDYAVDGAWYAER
jgi:RNA 2',3'-cyclic 3'-phosphodiesterase